MIPEEHPVRARISAECVFNPALTEVAAVISHKRPANNFVQGKGLEDFGIGA